MGLQKTTAVILCHRDFGESDKIVTFFTSTLGKVKGIAKGAKRSRRRFANQLELFSLVQTIFFEKKSSSLSRIEECDLLEPFASIREIPEKYAYAAYFAELADVSVKEHDPHLELFNLLVWAFHNIDQGISLNRLSLIFHLRLLSIVGYAPTFTRCINCNTWKDGFVQYTFDFEKGGIICSACFATHNPEKSFSPGTLKLLSLAQRIPLNKLLRLHFGIESQMETAHVLETFTHNLIGKEIKSFQFLAQTKKTIRNRLLTAKPS